MALYALGDLHLSFQTGKKMDMFGKVWRNHERKIEKNCNKLLTEDTFLVKLGKDYLVDYLAVCPDKRNSGAGGVMVNLLAEYNS